MAELDFNKTVARVTFVYQVTGDTETKTNVIYVKREDGLAMTGTDAGVIGLAVTTWWNAEMGPSIVDDVTLIRAEIKLLDGPDSQQFEQNSGATGDLTGTPLPPNVGFSVKKITGLIGRRHRGRWFVLGLQETDVDATGVISSTRADEFVAALEELIQDLLAAGDGYNYGFVSLASGTPTFRTVTSHSYADLVVATLRKRLNK